MARRTPEKRISIGQDRWIRYGDLGGGQARAIEIDSQLAPLTPLLESLEVVCVADCCGIDAFHFWPETIEKTIATLGQGELEKLVSALASVQREIERLPSDTVVSTRINQYFRKTVFLELLAHIRDVVEGAHAKFA